jgi:hypothetical protein
MLHRRIFLKILGATTAALSGTRVEQTFPANAEPAADGSYSHGTKCRSDDGVSAKGVPLLYRARDTVHRSRYRPADSR